MRSALRIALLLAIAGCNAVLGIEAGVYEPIPDAGTSSGDAPIDGAGPPPDDVDAEPPADGGDTPTVDARTPDPLPPESGPCEKLDTNARHCGRCNHDCGTGMCTGGVCQAGLIVADTTGAVSIAKTATHLVYQTAHGEIRRISPWGGSPVTLYKGASSNSLGQNIVVIGDYVYFADRDGARIARCDVPRATAAETVIEGFPKPYSLATAGGAIYASDGIRGTTIRRCKQPPCGTQSEVFASGELGITRIVASATHLAWSTITGQGRASIRVQPVLSGAATTPFEDPTAGLLGATSLVVTTTYVYMAFRADLYRLEHATGALQLLRTDIGATETLNLYGAYLFYGDFYGGDVYRRSVDAISSLPSNRIVDGEPSLDALTRSGNDLYWSANDKIWGLSL